MKFVFFLLIGLSVYSQDFRNGDFSKDISATNKNARYGWVQLEGTSKWKMTEANSGIVQNLQKGGEGFLKQSLDLKPKTNYVWSMEYKSSNDSRVPFKLSLEGGATFADTNTGLVNLKKNNKFKITKLKDGVYKLEVNVKSGVISDNVDFVIQKGAKQDMITYFDNVRLRQGKIVTDGVMPNGSVTMSSNKINKKKKIKKHTANTTAYVAPIWSE